MTRRTLSGCALLTLLSWGVSLSASDLPGDSYLKLGASSIKNRYLLGEPIQVVVTLINDSLKWEIILWDSLFDPQWEFQMRLFRDGEEVPYKVPVCVYRERSTFPCGVVKIPPKTAMSRSLVLWDGKYGFDLREKGVYVLKCRYTVAREAADALQLQIVAGCLKSFSSQIQAKTSLPGLFQETLTVRAWSGSVDAQPLRFVIE